MKKSINIYWAIRLACKKTGQTVKKFLSISCFSFQLTLITVLWLERVNYFCLLNKTILFFLFAFPNTKQNKRTLYPAAFVTQHLNLSVWSSEARLVESMRKEKSSPCRQPLGRDCTIPADWNHVHATRCCRRKPLVPLYKALIFANFKVNNPLYSSIIMKNWYVLVLISIRVSCSPPHNVCYCY